MPTLKLSTWLPLVLTVFAAVVILAAGCGTSHPPFGGDGWDTTLLASPGSACNVEGQQGHCSKELARHGNVATCIDGVATCVRGVWSDCRLADGDTRIRSVAIPTGPAPAAGPSGGGTLRTLAITGAVSCSSTPCDPTCQEFSSATPVTASGTSAVIVGQFGGSLAQSNVPGGFKDKLTDIDHVCAGCTQYNTPTATSTVTLAQCQSACYADQHCTGNGTNTCTAFYGGAKNWCTGVDVTVATTCLSSSGQFIIPVCSRGSQDITQPVVCCSFPGNSPHFADELDSSQLCAGGTYVATTAGTIAAGTCQELAIDSIGGTKSIICNPLSASSFTAGPRSATAPGSGVSGGWTIPNNPWGATQATAVLGPAAFTSTFSISSAVAGSAGSWGSTSNAAATSADTLYMTTTVATASAVTTGARLPSSNSAVSSVGWSTPANAYSASDSGAFAWAATTLTTSATGASASVVTPKPGNIGWENSSSDYTISHVLGAPDGAFIDGWPDKGGAIALALSGFTALTPATNASITAFAVSLVWKEQLTSDECTVSVDLVDSLGNQVVTIDSSGATRALGALFSDDLGQHTTAFTSTIWLTAGQRAQLPSSWLAAPRLRINVANGNNGNPSTNRIYIDSAQLFASYSGITQSFGNFGFGGVIPAGASVTQVNWSARYAAVSPDSTSYIRFRAYVGATPIGAAHTITNPSTSMTTDTWSDAVTLPDTSLADGTFTLRVEAGGGKGGFIAEVDYVSSTVAYVSTGGSNAISLGNFNVNLGGCTNISQVVTTARWLSSAATGSVSLQAYTGTNALGAATSASPPPTGATTVNNSYTGPISAADLANGSFSVRLTATPGSSDYTLSVDYVAVTVYCGPTSASVDLSAFGFAIPAGATITGVNVSLTDHVSTAGNPVDIRAQALRLVGGVWTDIGAVADDAAPGTSNSVHTDTASSLGVPADYNDGNFIVRLTATAGSGATQSFTAYAGPVTVAVGYNVVSSVAECDSLNNWSAGKDNPAPPACVNMTSNAGFTPFAATFDYQPSCPTGKIFQWGFLSYDAGQSMPSAGGSTASVKFEAQVTTAMSTTSAWMTLANTAAPESNPSYCPLLGISNCPIDVYDNVLMPAGGLGYAQAPQLSLRVTLTPSCDIQASPCIGSVSPVVNSWQLTFSCADNF